MATLCWTRLADEMFEAFPDILVTEGRRTSQQILPILSFIYALMAQTTNPELTLVQRTLAAVLADSLCDVQVIDDLLSGSMCINYTTTQRMIQSIPIHL